MMTDPIADFLTRIRNGNLARKIYTVDAKHPATKDWPDGVAIIDEYYQFYHTSPATGAV